MAKRINKAKRIKQYFGDIIKEYGFEYAGANAGIWLFVRKKNKVMQEVFLQQHRFFPNQVKMVFHTYAFGWRDQEPRNYMEEYKDQEFWKYDTEEEYIEILKEFANILKSHGLEMLEKMLIPADPIYPTEEMERKLYESYSLLIEDARIKYPFERTGEEAVRKVSELIYQSKDKDYEDVKDFLVEMAAIYMEIWINDMGGKVVLEQVAGMDKCLLKETGIRKTAFVWILLSIVTRWKECRRNIDDESDWLISKYRDLKR